MLFSAHLGEHAFYDVVPYAAIVVPASLIGLYILAVLLVGGVRFWRASGGNLSELLDVRALTGVTWDVLRLRYLEGGGHGCNYPDEEFSQSRRWLHHLVFYGFFLNFAATVVAAIYDHVFHWPAPYPFWSLPVLRGRVGGLGLVVGSVGLLWLKGKMDREPASQRAVGMDVGFLVLLFLTGLTGLVLLALRATPAMGTLLAVHLGIVVALFLTLPCGKFVHAVYRYAALIRYSIEQSGEGN